MSNNCACGLFHVQDNIETWNAVALLLLCTDVEPIAGKRLTARTLPHRGYVVQPTEVRCHGEEHNEAGPEVEGGREKHNGHHDVKHGRKDIEQHVTATHTHKHQNDIVFCHKIVHLYDDACCYITFVTSIVQCCGATRPRRPNRGPVIAILLMLTWESWWCSSRLGPWYESLFLFFESGASVLTSC